MSIKKYYVYGLIDPRNNQYFYIGKGSGKRFSSHLKSNKRDLNSQKLDKIKEIQNSGYEVKIEILFPNLDEETAFELENIIIYKLGRNVFSEGILTNLNPGGKWSLGDPIFYNSSIENNFDIYKLDFISQQKFTEIPNLSKFNYLNTKDNQQIIYKFNTDGKFEQALTLNELFFEGVKGYEIELLRAIRNNKLPIYSRWIYSKNKVDNLYISSKLPLVDFDIIDEQFHKNFDYEYDIKDIFELDCIVDGDLRMNVRKEREVISLHSYFPSGNKKSLQKTKNGKPFELACEWFDNGNLSVKEELKNGYSDYTRTTYFENGQEHIRTSRGNGKKEYDRWFENGNREVQYNENSGYTYFNEDGEKIGTI